MIKKLYYLFFSILIFLIIGATVQAGFVPQAKLEQVVIKIADFVPPPETKFIFDQKYFAAKPIRFEWVEVDDYENLSSIVTYEFKLDKEVYRTQINYLELNLSEFQVGEHKISIRACDEIGNCGIWSQDQELIIDELPPSIEVLDQKISVDKVYGYIKLKLNDNYGLEKFFISPSAGLMEQSFFDEGYFYQHWSNQFRDDFWLIILLANDQTTTNIFIEDFANNKSEKIITW